MVGLVLRGLATRKLRSALTAIAILLGFVAVNLAGIKWVTRVAIPVLEDVTTRTIRSLEHREGFAGAIEYQMLKKTGDVFVDSDLEHKAKFNFLGMGLPSAQMARSGQPHSNASTAATSS